MAFISQIEIKQTAKGSDYKSVRLDSPVLGKDRFNVFKFHSRYADITEGKELKPNEFQFSPDGKYLELIDPDKGVKKGLGGQGSANNDTLERILAGQTIISAKLDQLLKNFAEQPPF